MQGQLKDWDLPTMTVAWIAAGALMQYLVETQKRDLSHISHLTIYAAGKYMLLDSSTRRNLELCENTARQAKNVVPFSGYWIRQRPQWAQEHYANTLNSR